MHQLASSSSLRPSSLYSCYLLCWEHGSVDQGWVSDCGQCGFQQQLCLLAAPGAVLPSERAAAALPSETAAAAHAALPQPLSNMELPKPVYREV